MNNADAAEVFQPLQADDPHLVAGYRLAARLGAGGMGRVYLSHTQGGRPLAIKVVRPELADDPAIRRRFRREIAAARRVRGAYTAELIDADADGAPPWLATLYVPGPSLTEAVARRGPLPVPAVLWLMAGVAEALGAIHGAGIVHRDLK
ncbi:protein kinase domain-containing protein, partial [Streptomyces sp. NPDC004290]